MMYVRSTIRLTSLEYVVFPIVDEHEESSPGMDGEE